MRAAKNISKKFDRSISSHSWTIPDRWTDRLFIEYSVSTIHTSKKQDNHIPRVQIPIRRTAIEVLRYDRCCSVAGFGDAAHEYSGDALRLRRVSWSVCRTTDARSSSGQRDTVRAHREGRGGNIWSTVVEVQPRTRKHSRRQRYAQLWYRLGEGNITDVATWTRCRNFVNYCSLKHYHHQL